MEAMKVGGYEIDVLIQGFPGRMVCHGGLGWSTVALVRGEGRVALVDVGIRNPQVAIQALDLRGRRVRRPVILVSDGETPTPPGVGKLGMEVVRPEYAVSAVLAALRGER